jgi:hypothetical protein
MTSVSRPEQERAHCTINPSARPVHVGRVSHRTEAMAWQNLGDVDALMTLTEALETYEAAMSYYGRM